MIVERDRSLTYYADTSIWNQLAHQPEPGRPEWVARLKRARDEGQAQTYLSRYLIQELVGAFVRFPEIGRRLLKTVQTIVLPGWLVKDSPDLYEQDVLHLVDPSVNVDFLEPYWCLNAQKMAHAVDVLAQDGPLDSEWTAFCDRWRQNAWNIKKKWTEEWEKYVAAERKHFDMANIPETFTLADFMVDPRGTSAMLAMVTRWTPPELKKVMPLEDLARRLDETASLRGMLYYMTSLFFWKVLKKEELEHGDAFDAHHGLMAANCDVYVCNDEKSRKFARAWCRNGQRVASLEEFIKDLG